MNKLYEELKQFRPADTAETEARQVMLREIEQQGERLLDRENEAHFTSSAFIVNPARTKTLMVHHNLRNTWSWAGGHADGMHDLEANARKELLEETGVADARLLGGIAGLDIFHVPAHVKKGKPVAAHRHLSVDYIFEVDESAELRICPDENSSVEWLDVSLIAEPLFSEVDVRIYTKLLERSVKFTDHSR